MHNYVIQILGYEIMCPVEAPWAVGQAWLFRGRIPQRPPEPGFTFVRFSFTYVSSFCDIVI